MRKIKACILTLLLLLALGVCAGAEELEWKEADGTFADLTLQPQPPEGEAAEFYESVDTASAIEQMQQDIVRKIQEVGPGVRFSIPNRLGYQMSDSDIYGLYFNALYNYPEETYWVKTYVRYGGDSSYLYYTATAAIERDAAAYTAAVDAAYDACISDDMTPVEKVVSAYSYLVNNCQYDPYVANHKQDYTAPDGTFYGEDPAVYTSYGTFVKKNCVCQGYALAMQVLMNRAGVPCCYVSSGSTAMNHAWNMVQLDGAWYHVDVTWGDGIYSIGDWAGRVGYEYLLCSDSEFESKNHYGWTTQNSYTCPVEYSGPNVWEGISTPIFYDGTKDLFYVLEGDTTLVPYTVGSSFSQSGNPLMETATYYGADSADFSPETGTYCYQTGSAKVYVCNLWEDPTVQEIVGTTPDYRSGVFLTTADIDGAERICAKQEYHVVWSAVVNVATTGGDMPLKIGYSKNLTEDSSLSGERFIVRNTTAQEVDYGLYAAYYNAEGRMMKVSCLASGTLAAGAQAESEAIVQAPAGAVRIRVFAIGAGIPLSLTVSGRA